MTEMNILNTSATPPCKSRGKVPFLLCSLALTFIAAVLSVEAVAPDPVSLRVSHDARQVAQQSMFNPGISGFEPNVGQANPSVDFLCRMLNGSLFLDGTSAYLVMESPLEAGETAGSPGQGLDPMPPRASHMMRISLLDAADTPAVAGEDLLPGHVNFYLGRDPSQWHEGVPTYGQIRYKDVYPGVDLVYHGRRESLEFDFELAPESDPAMIRMHFDGVDSLHHADDGALTLHTPAGVVRLKAPLVYHDSLHGRQEVAAAYRLLSSNCVGFVVSGNDPRQPLIIDPVLEFATYFGGTGQESSRKVAVASDGSIYLLGSTYSSDLPVTLGAFQTNYPSGSNGGFLTKFDPTGSQVLFSTYLAGTQYVASVQGLVLDSQERPVISATVNQDFPYTAGSIHTTALYGAICVLKLDTTGALVFSSLIDGPNNEFSSDVALDSADNIYLLGGVYGPATLPMVRSYQSAVADRSETVFFKLNPTASTILYSSYLGGTGNDSPTAIAADNSGNAFLVGSTASTDFPQKNSPQPGNRGGGDAFVAKFNTLASGAASLVYSRYLGGSKYEMARDIALDLAGNAYVCGQTTSSNSFPTTSSGFQLSYGGDDPFIEGDGFISKIGPTALTLYSTYLGGGGWDIAVALYVSDTGGIVRVIGTTASQNFPLTNELQSTLSGPCDGLGCWSDLFVTELNTSIPGSGGLQFSTYLGGASGGSAGGGIAMAPGGAIVGAGDSRQNFPITPGVVQPDLAGSSDVVLFMIGPGTTLVAEKSDLMDPANRELELTYSIIVSNAGPGVASGVMVEDVLPAALAFVSATPSQGSCTESNGTITCVLGSIPNGGSASVNLTVIPVIEGMITNTATVSSPSDPAIGSNPVSETTRVEPPPDIDGDGLPDWFEQLYYSSPTNAIPGDNGDGDIYTILQEYIIDSNPTLSNDFGIGEIVVESPPQLSFPSSAIRAYDLDRSSNLVEGFWLNVVSNALGNGQVLTLIDTNEIDKSYYRIRVSVPVSE